MAIEDTKENIKKLASFIIKSRQKGWTIFRFKQLEDELQISKPEIISIFDLFCKAKIFDYQIIPWGHPEEMKYDFAKTKEIIDSETGGFSLLNYDKIEKKEKMTKTDVNLLAELIESPDRLNIFLEKYGRHLKLPIFSSEFEQKIGSLKINLKTGDFEYFKTTGNLSPLSQEFKFISLLITSESNQSDYDSLLKVIHPNADKASKISRFYIYTVIRNIKEKLEILPKNNKSNKDCFKNVKSYGYKLILR